MMAESTSPGEMIRAIVNHMQRDTGRSFDNWVALARAEGPSSMMKCLEWLRDNYSLNHYRARFIATEAINPGQLFAYDRPDELLDALYSGPKAHLRAIYEEVRAAALGLAEDIEEVVCKTYTSFRHRAQFAIAVPRTNKYLDLELAMPAGTPAAGHLEAIKSSNAKITHRIRLATAEDFNDEALQALLLACDNVRKK
jgi:predicted transport protein